MSTQIQNPFSMGQIAHLNIELPSLRLESRSYPRCYGSSYRVIAGDIQALGRWLETLGFHSARLIENPWWYEHYWLNGASFELWKDGRVTTRDWWIGVISDRKIDGDVLIAPLVQEVAPNALDLEKLALEVIGKQD